MARSKPENGQERNAALDALLDELHWTIRGFARRVREHCQALGLSYSVDPSTVARWCANKSTPSAPLASVACRVLSEARRQPVPPESLGWPATEDLATESLEYADLGHAIRMLSRLWTMDALQDRSVIKKMFQPGVFGPASREALVMPADADLTGYGSYKVAPGDIQLLEEQTALYGALDAKHGGGKFRSVFAAFLSTHSTPLLAGSFSARLGRRLYGSVADAVLAMASMAYDDQLPGIAQRYDLQAMRLAQAIGDRARIARVHIHQARLAAAQGDRRDVLTHARGAVLACDGAPALVQAYAAITEARAWAFNGFPGQALEAVARARNGFDRARASSQVAWLSWFDRYELEAQAAWALAVAGLAETGEEALKEAEGMPQSRTRDQVELLITGAELARLRGDSAEQAQRVKAAVDASRHLVSRRLLARIARLTAGEPLDDF